MLDLGDYGDETPEPVYITQSPLSSLRGVLLWLPLILAIVLDRSNRRLSLLWLLIPFAIMKLGLAILAKATGMPSEIVGVFEYLSFGPLLVGMATVLLVGHRLGHLGVWVRILTILLILLCCIGMGLASFGFYADTAPGLLCYAVIAISVVLAQALCAFSCRQRFSLPKYFLWLALSTFGLVFLAMLIYLVIVMMFQDFGMQLGPAILQLLLVTGVFSVMLYGIQLPYVLLGSFNRFYRERFSALLGIARVRAKGSTP